MSGEPLSAYRIAISVPAFGCRLCAVLRAIVRPRTQVLSVVITAVVVMLMMMPRVSGQERTGDTRRVSCMTATCHGAVLGRGPVWRSSGSRYLADDPHRSAYQTLWTEESAQIVGLLDQEAVKSGSAYRRFLAARCNSCHASHENSLEETDSNTVGSNLAGAAAIGCADCHGAVAEWLIPHRLKSWQELGDGRFTAPYQMRDTESFTGLAGTCVGCHVGSRPEEGPTRDVNHDLIAAGHPPMRFELTRYFDALPPHWDTAAQDRRIAEQGGTAQMYLVGRHAALMAALRLSARRAEEAAGNAGDVTYPELSELNCFACHQEVVLQGRAVSSVEREQENILWSAWYTAGCRTEAVPELADFARRMGDFDLTAEEGSARASRAIQRVAEVEPGDLFPEPAAVPPTSWQAAAQRWLRDRAELQDLLRAGTAAGEIAESSRRLDQRFQSQVVFTRPQQRNDGAARLLSPVKQNAGTGQPPTSVDPRSSPGEAQRSRNDQPQERGQ